MAIDDDLYLAAAVNQIHALRSELEATKQIMWAMAQSTGGEVFVADKTTLESFEKGATLLKIPDRARGGYIIKAARKPSG